ncbi:MAG: PEP-CTERM sorting domain-containing protein [Phycisphaerae bacterium]|nr:PEP-CTERM sorting domain-containing protein [Phycisphaerae bacterium]
MFTYEFTAASSTANFTIGKGSSGDTNGLLSAFTQEQAFVPVLTATPDQDIDPVFSGSTRQLNHAFRLSGGSPATSDITVTNSGEPGSTLQITGWDVTGPNPDASMFGLHYINGGVVPSPLSISLAPGSSQHFELWFKGASAPGVYGDPFESPYTMLTIYTNAGNIGYYPQVTVPPEPATMALLALGGLTMVGAGLRRRWRGSK